MKKKSIKGILAILIAFIFFQNSTYGDNKKTIDTKSLIFATPIITIVENGEQFEITEYYKNNERIAYEKYFNDVLVEKWGEIPDGLIITLHSSGELGSLITYKKQLPHGIALSFYKDGTLSSIAYYKEGKTEGVSKIYYPNGRIHVEQKHLDGIELYYKQYDVNGTIEFER